MTQDSGLRTQDSGLRTQDSGLRTQDELCSDIDFVIPWVDGSDPEWQALKARYKLDEDKASGTNTAPRYRDWGILRYWFRSVERFAPWVRKIHFITCGQCPDWLNINNPKINFVQHKDYIPQEWLPTFCSRPIELNIFRVKGLSEKFVFFNDDMFINAPVRPEDFFVNDLPCDTAILHPGPFPEGPEGVTNVMLNDIQTINKNFEFRTQFRANFTKWINLRYGIKKIIRTLLLRPFGFFTGFVEFHTANSYLKSTFIEVWETEGEVLAKTSSHRFRDRSDVNQWLMKYWQIAKGSFYPRSPGFSRYYGGNFISCEEALINDIKNHVHKLICINDNDRLKRFEELSARVRQVYSEVYPDKSEFEL